MKYRLTALTPLLVGDGRKLAPIDYMVWRDQVNVLDQDRIVKLLAKGPRLEGYLTQIRRAEKLDFASWGGFAQNFAGRRIPFEHPSLTRHWEQARAEHLFIPTFCAGASGQYLPASAIRGALRTGWMHARWSPGIIREIASRMTGDRPMRRPGEAAEDMSSSGADPMRLIRFGDSGIARADVFRIYLLRVASLSVKAPEKFEAAWKPAPLFAEMAPAGTSFEGGWELNEFLQQPETARALRLRVENFPSELLRAANEYAAGILEAHKRFAASAGLKHVEDSVAAVEARLSEVRSRGGSCLLNIGWGGGFFGKSAFIDTANEEYRKILRQLPYFERAIRSGLPFPKTRRVIHLDNQPATLPGWATLDLLGN